MIKQFVIGVTALALTAVNGCTSLQPPKYIENSQYTYEEWNKAKEFCEDTSVVKTTLWDRVVATVDSASSESLKDARKYTEKRYLKKLVKCMQEKGFEVK